MNASSASQLRFDFAAADPMGPAPTPGLNRAQSRQGPSDDGGPASIRVPSFEGYSSVHAVAARQAGRVNASTISEAEHKALLKERAALLDRLFDDTITRQEENRLAYVRWSLDRIEDAKYGANLDLIESAISKYEQFAKDLEGLRKDLQEHLKK